MVEKTVEQRLEELEQRVQKLEARPSGPRARPANWPKLDANGQPYGGRFAGE